MHTEGSPNSPPWKTKATRSTHVNSQTLGRIQVWQLLLTPFPGSNSYNGMPAPMRQHDSFKCHSNTPACCPVIPEQHHLPAVAVGVAFAPAGTAAAGTAAAAGVAAAAAVGVAGAAAAAPGATAAAGVGTAASHVFLGSVGRSAGAGQVSPNMSWKLHTLWNAVATAAAEARQQQQQQSQHAVLYISTWPRGLLPARLACAQASEAAYSLQNTAFSGWSGRWHPHPAPLLCR